MPEDVFDSIQSRHRESGNSLRSILATLSRHKTPTATPEQIQFYRNYWFERAWMLSVGEDHFCLDV